MLSDLLLLSDGSPARPHASLTLPSGAIFVIPKHGPARRGGLAVYNPTAVAGLAAKSLMWTGLWSGKTVDVLAEPLDELCQILADQLGELHVECAFWFGASGIYSKLVILVMNAAGRALAYAKVAATATAQVALLHENSILQRLSTVSSLRGRIPYLLGQAEWRGFPLVLLSPGPSRRAPRRFGAMHRDFLFCVTKTTRVPGMLVESPMWLVMNELLGVWRFRLSRTWQDRYDWALVELERRFGRRPIDLALAHHDFTPWNTRANSNGTLFVFDWEFSREGATPGWDFFHFHVSSLALLKKRPLDRDDVISLIAAARREGIEPADDLLLAYLADVSLFHHDASFRGGTDRGFFEVTAQAIDICLKLKR
jgi:hypothetical protein